MTADQFRCEHGHGYYDGDQGIGDPYTDGDHNGRYHEPALAAGWADGWEPWERDLYEKGYANGLDDRAGTS